MSKRNYETKNAIEVAHNIVLIVGRFVAETSSVVTLEVTTRRPGPPVKTSAICPGSWSRHCPECVMSSAKRGGRAMISHLIQVAEWTGQEGLGIAWSASGLSSSVQQPVFDWLVGADGNCSSCRPFYGWKQQ